MSIKKRVLRNQLGTTEWHPKRVLKLKQILLFSVIVMAAVGCNQKKETPDDIREKTANATAEIKQNAQALAQGVKEGLHRGNTIDLNKCSKDDLLTLPGVSKDTADRVLAARPYDDTHELVSRKLVSEAEFGKIKDKVTATQ